MGCQPCRAVRERSFIREKEERLLLASTNRSVPLFPLFFFFVFLRWEQGQVGAVKGELGAQLAREGCEYSTGRVVVLLHKIPSNVFECKIQQVFPVLSAGKSR